LALYKRAANLAEKAEASVLPNTEAFVEPAEEALGAALPGAQRAVEGLLAAVRERLEPWDLGRGPARTLTGVADQAAGVLRLKAPLDAFLDDVLVMVDDPALRRNRLALLAQVTFILRELGSLEHLGA